MTNRFIEHSFACEQVLRVKLDYNENKHYPISSILDALEQLLSGQKTVIVDETVWKYFTTIGKCKAFDEYNIKAESEESKAFCQDMRDKLTDICNRHSPELTVSEKPLKTYSVGITLKPIIVKAHNSDKAENKAYEILASKKKRCEYKLLHDHNVLIERYDTDEVKEGE